jgi:hypothetical protein
MPSLRGGDLFWAVMAGIVLPPPVGSVMIAALAIGLCPECWPGISAVCLIWMIGVGIWVYRMGERAESEG